MLLALFNSLKNCHSGYIKNSIPDRLYATAAIKKTTSWQNAAHDHWQSDIRCQHASQNWSAAVVDTEVGINILSTFLLSISANADGPRDAADAKSTISHCTLSIIIKQ